MISSVIFRTLENDRVLTIDNILVLFLSVIFLFSALKLCCRQSGSNNVRQHVNIIKQRVVSQMTMDGHDVQYMLGFNDASNLYRY